jgi:hypothetical protein
MRSTSICKHSRATNCGSLVWIYGLENEIGCRHHLLLHIGDHLFLQLGPEPAATGTSVVFYKEKVDLLYMFLTLKQMSSLRMGCHVRYLDIFYLSFTSVPDPCHCGTVQIRILGYVHLIPNPEPALFVSDSQGANKKNFPSIFCLLHFLGIFTYVRSKQTVEIKVFLNFFFAVDERIQIRRNNYGSGWQKNILILNIAFR